MAFSVEQLLGRIDKQRDFPLKPSQVALTTEVRTLILNNLGDKSLNVKHFRYFMLFLLGSRDLTNDIDGAIRDLKTHNLEDKLERPFFMALNQWLRTQKSPLYVMVRGERVSLVHRDVLLFELDPLDTLARDMDNGNLGPFAAERQAIYARRNAADIAKHLTYSRICGAAILWDKGEFQAARQLYSTGIQQKDGNLYFSYKIDPTTITDPDERRAYIRQLTDGLYNTDRLSKEPYRLYTVGVLVHKENGASEWYRGSKVDKADFGQVFEIEFLLTKRVSIESPDRHFPAEPS